MGKYRWLRRTSQGLFLLVFIDLLLRTEFRGSVRIAGGATQLPLPLHIFFDLDPLVALSTFLATHHLYRGLWLSLWVLIPTLLLGRFFCGWICPMGTLNQIISALPSRYKRGKAGIETNRYKQWQATKYYILIVVLLASAAGTGIVGWFDPFSLLVRSVGLGWLPTFDYAAKAALQWLESSQISILQVVGEALHSLLETSVLSYTAPHYRQGLVLAIVFALLLALNLRITRLWCRGLCPLGALLGAVSRWSFLNLKKNTSTCNQCQRCERQCQGGDDPLPGASWHKAECHLCLNCVSSCPHSSIGFSFGLSEAQVIKEPDIQRRQAIVSAIGGIAIVPLLRSASGIDVETSQRLVRPPGSLAEKDFLDRCIRCGECMKICPTNTLQPSLTDAGVEGLWTPMLAPRIGFCEPKCTLCSQVCPTGAIAEITLQQKAWDVERTGKSNRIRLGTAFIDRGRCLPWSIAQECGICAKACPEFIRAINLITIESTDPVGAAKVVKQPHINLAQCVGCGACEYACPLHERPAVYITNSGESRSPSSRILVNGRNVSAGE